MSKEILYILKWTAVIIITGFFAQFGKMLAQYIVKKIREKKAKQEDPKTRDNSEVFDAPSTHLQNEKEKLKLEKKRLKLERKRRKE